MVVVIVSLLSLATSNLPGAGPLRLLRCLRVFRLFKRIPPLRQIMLALTSSVPAVASAFALVCLISAIYSVVAVTFFRSLDPDLFGDFFTGPRRPPARAGDPREAERPSDRDQPVPDTPRLGRATFTCAAHAGAPPTRAEVVADQARARAPARGARICRIPMCVIWGRVWGRVAWGRAAGWPGARQGSSPCSRS